jgi:hypothetical protein
MILNAWTYIKYYNTNYPEKPLDIKMPNLCFRELTGRPQYLQALEANSGIGNDL